MIKLLLPIAALSVSLAAAHALDIPDRDLRTAIAGALGIPAAELTEADLLDLVDLDPGDKLITDLTGLELAINLETAVLEDDQLEDLSALAGLTKLRELDLYDNRITDLSALAGLTSLETLVLRDNRITDFSPLTSLPNLKTLVLEDNRITTLPDLSGLTSIEVLDLTRNPINPTSPEVIAAQRELAARGATLLVTGLPDTRPPPVPTLTIDLDGSAPSTLTVSWPTRPGHTYQLRFSEDASTWFDIGAPLAATVPTARLTIPRPAAKTGLFQVTVTASP